MWVWGASLLSVGCLCCVCFAASRFGFRFVGVLFLGLCLVDVFCVSFVWFCAGCFLLSLVFVAQDGVLFDGAVFGLFLGLAFALCGYTPAGFGWGPGGALVAWFAACMVLWTVLPLLWAPGFCAAVFLMLLC